MSELRIRKYIKNKNIHSTKIPNDVAFETIKYMIDNKDLNSIVGELSESDKIKFIEGLGYFEQINLLNSCALFDLKTQIEKVLLKIFWHSKTRSGTDMLINFGYVLALLDLEKANLLKKDLNEILSEAWGNED